ncbi:hypothetical protein SAMN04244572_04353 [Azotobacter beijerinckii]|uniref:Uncharacterized protein n=1 Tax=Azotobacter beijerinckii TaxID=170623 RepID=A0A1H6ZI13_9GAMM|nr:hypothetical protein [Azotobacter beijerinckii]SEJ52938.1 hypothetical protein SAMN04244572_04353 [Azotobacter beijerinckii]
MADIELLKRLAEAATPGPWAYEAHGDTGEYGVGFLLDEDDQPVEGRQEPGEMLVAEPVAPEVSGATNAAFIAAANPSAILALITEVERLREVLAEKLIDSTMLTGIDIGNGSLTIGAKGGVCGIMADSFGQMLFESGAENYIEAFFSSSKHPELGQIVVTVKRETGKTPHQLRQVAEAERDQLKAEIEALRQIISDSATACGAAMSPECTVEFMGHLPAEIASVLRQFRAAHAVEQRRAAVLEQNCAEMAEALERVRADVNFFDQQCRREKLTCMQPRAELGRLQEQQKPAGGAGAAENCRCNEKAQVVQELQAELEWVRVSLREISAIVDGNIREIVRDLVNRDAGLKNGANPNDIYEECDRIDAAIDAAMGNGGGQNGTKTAETRASAGLEGGGHGGNSGGAENAFKTAETREIDGVEGGAEKGGKADG